MLLSRSRLHSAKLKISELKLKYSADTVLTQSEETVNDVINNDSNNKDVQSVSSVGHVKQNSIHLNQPSKETSMEHSFDNEELNGVLTKRLLEQTIPQTSSLELRQNFGLSEVETNESNSKYGSSLVLSNPRDSDIELSDEVSQVLNQLDNLCFISTSSEEQINTITECSSCEQQNLIQTTRDVVDEIQILSNNAELKPSSKQAKTDGNKIINASLEQSEHSEVGSTVSSKLKSMSERDSMEYHYSSSFTDSKSGKSHMNNVSYQGTSDIDKASEVSTVSKNSIQIISNIFERQQMHRGLIKDQTKPKRCKYVPHNRDTLNCDNNTNKGTNNANILNEQTVSTEFDSKHSKKYIDTNLTLTKSKANDGRGNVQRTRKNRSTNVNISFLCQKNPKPKLIIGFNQDVKRPVLKSSRLIKHHAQPRDVLCFPLPDKQHTVITEQLHHPTKLSAGNGDYEQIINNLLLNQIQLTRHFIDSHHKMYLLCCQAAKKLSEGYISEHRGLPTRTPQDKFTTRI